MRRYLLWANSSEEVLQEIVIREENWGSRSVIRMNVTDFHVLKSLFVIVLFSILSLVFDIRTKGR